MAEILGLGCTHWPILAFPDERLAGTFKKTLTAAGISPEAKDPAHWPEELRRELGDDDGVSAARIYSARLAENFRAMRKQLDAFQPDVVLIWGDDQYENFKEDIVPPFCILAYEDQDIQPWAGSIGNANRWNEPADFVFPVKGAQNIGKRLTSALIGQGIDMSYAYRPLHQTGLSHAFLMTLLFLDWDRQGFPYPVLPMAVNCYGSDLLKAKGGLAKLLEPASSLDDVPDPPSPTPRRCMEVGAAIADYFLTTDLRVALIASASWSHAFLSPTNNFLWSDIDSDRRMLETLKAGRYDFWRDATTTDMEHAGQHEMLNWMLLAGAMEKLGRVATVHDYMESHLFSSQKVFVSFPSNMAPITEVA